jgi:hypothetical protein
MGVVFVVHEDLTSQALEGFFPMTAVCIGTGLRPGWPRNLVRFVAWPIAVFCRQCGFTLEPDQERGLICRG